MHWLASWHEDARRRTLELVRGLSSDQLMGPRLPIVNPLRWEIGHVAWFQEFWALRHARGEPPLRADADDLYDSIQISHDARWDLPLPSFEETLRYAGAVLDSALGWLRKKEPSPMECYFHQLVVLHEDMHDEAFTYTRQTLAYPEPEFSIEEVTPTASGPLPGDVEVPGGTFFLGAADDGRFVFDNEKWAHPVEIAPFRIARAPVTNAEFARFVDDGGYRRRELWSDEGWKWRIDAGAERPVYWRPARDGSWEIRRYDRWEKLQPHQPVIHVSWYEADAYCRWAGRRLPTEAEWEVAAAGETATGGDSLAERKRRFPWGDEEPTGARANLDGAARGPVEVAAFPHGESAFGCRQMIGNVWEWTASDFLPYPGFVADPYKEYSEPWFGDHKVLRGGCWATRARLIRNTWRNFYTAGRRDVFAGFRTCSR